MIEVGKDLRSVLSSEESAANKQSQMQSLLTAFDLNKDNFAGVWAPLETNLEPDEIAVFLEVSNTEVAALERDSSEALVECRKTSAMEDEDINAVTVYVQHHVATLQKKASLIKLEL